MLIRVYWHTLLKKSTIWSIIIIYNTLRSTDVKLTGRYIYGLISWTFLKKGMVFASFHCKGTIPSCSDMLHTCASGILICSTVYFRIVGAIPSTPGDLLSFILFTLLGTTSGVTTNCHNLSPTVPLHFVSSTGNELVSSLVNTELKCLFNLSAI